MNKYIFILSVLLTFVLVRSDGASELNQIPDQVQNTTLIEKPNILTSLEQHLAAIQNEFKNYTQIFRDFENQAKSLNKTIEEQNTKINNLQHQLEKQLLINEVNKETIRKKDLMLQQEGGSTNNFQKKIFEINDKILSQINNISEMQAQIEKYITPSSCIGKLTDIYNVKVPGMEAFPVFCDSTLFNSGWTVVQRRMDGSINFNRNWTEYVDGFGDLRTEFWIGLEKLHQLTNSQTYELYIYLKDFKNETRYARYSVFVIGNKDELYKLKIGNYSGNAGDASNMHKDMKFSTADRDNDKWEDGNCAKLTKSGWWFSACYDSNLNGVYASGDPNQEIYGVNWRLWHYNALKFTQMMIRPKNK